MMMLSRSMLTVRLRRERAERKKKRKGGTNGECAE
jgi:hypothetical protein